MTPELEPTPAETIESKASKKRSRPALGPAASGLERAGSLLRRSWSRYRAQWWLLSGTAAVVALPLAALSLSESLINDAGFNAYAGIATFIAGLAIMSAVARPQDGKRRIRAHYYLGTGALVRLIVILVVLSAWALVGFTVLVAGSLLNGISWLRRWLLKKSAAAVVIRSLILTLAWVIAVASTLVALTVNLFAWVIVGYVGAFVVQLGALIVGLALAITIVPLVILIVRHSYALPLLINTELAPLQLLSESRRLVRRRLWATTGRLAALAAVVAVALLATIAVALLVGLVVRYQNIPQVFFQLILGVVVVPFAFVYLYELFTGARDHARTS